MQANTAPETAIQVTAGTDSLDAHGRVSAGWLFGQLDRLATQVGEVLTHGPIVVVSVNGFQLQVPVHDGETLTLRAECLRQGKSSLTLKLCAEALRGLDVNVMVTEVIITLVAVDLQGKSRIFSC